MDEKKGQSARNRNDESRTGQNPAIRFGEAYSLPPLEERLPPEELLYNFQQTNPLRQQPMQVYFAVEILDRIRRDLDKSPRVERGGLLIGHFFRDISDRRTIFTVVAGAISQPTQDSSVGHYTVTPTMITESRLVLEEHFPGSSVVGWYHSHPGHGIFLSEQDMRIVRGIYNAPWQIAFVRDTIRNKEGVFYGPEGIRLDGWLEMKTHAPGFIRAADVYGRLRDTPPGEQSALVDELRRLVANDIFLSHWRSLKSYQDVALDSSSALPAVVPPLVEAQVDTKPVPVETEDLITQIEIFESSPSARSEEPTTSFIMPPPSIEDAEQKDVNWREYKRGISLIKSDNLKSGLETLLHLEQSYPGLWNVAEWIKYAEEKLQQSQPRRPARSDKLSGQN